MTEQNTESNQTVNTRTFSKQTQHADCTGSLPDDTFCAYSPHYLQLLAASWSSDIPLFQRYVRL